MSSLVPRVYQEEAAREALEGNKIIRADTGTGKTLIAILLVRQISVTSNKSIVFLSPNVTLVYQQAAAIECSTSLRVKTFVGSDGVDYWKRDRWIEQLEACDVAVMTPQVFLNLCDNAYWSYERISLIVFDECHNCSKNHPSAVVMRNHYRPLKLRDPSLVPRILGLTASPIYNVKKPEKTISELEAILDSRILEIVSAATFSRKADEQLVEHAPLGAEPPLASKDRSLIEAMSGTGKIDKRAMTRAPACELVIALIECLEAFRDQPHFHAIVFVQQRHHAKILAQILGLVRSLNWIKPGYLTGHGGRVVDPDGETTKDIGMEIKEQQETVRRFRNEELNLLVATRVAEEGLDFQACNIVVRFDELQTITGYIQSRGRARAATALFVVIAEAGSEEASRYVRYVKQEEELKTLYAGRPDEELDEPELDNLPTYSTAAGALLTYKNSIPLVATFCSLLGRNDLYTPIQKPTYRFLDRAAHYKYQLTLPKIATLSQSTFVSDVFPTKKAARQQTAFNCCVALHKAGALDDYLLPVRETLSIGAKDALGRDVDRSPAPKHLVAKGPNPFGNIWASSTVVLHVVEIVRDTTIQTMGLLCAKPQAPLENGSIFGVDGRRVRVRIKSVREMRWSSEEERNRRMEQLEVFNRLCVRTQLNRQLGDDGRFHALWTPLDANGELDFSIIERAFLPLDLKTIDSDALVIVPYRRPRSRMGHLLRVRDDVTSSSVTSDILPDPPRHRRAVIAKYPLYAQYLKVLYEFDGLSVDSNDAIIEFEPTTYAPYYLGPLVDIPPQRKTGPVRIFPASMCLISNLSPEFWEAFAMVPAINRLVETRTVAKLAIERLKLPRIDVGHLAEALTTPLSQVGFDYQYLETLGDAFLQLATSIHIYLEFPTSEEGRLSILRSNSVDNRFLRQQSVRSGLNDYLQSFPLRWSTFVPGPSDAAEVSGDSETISRPVSRKHLSDVVEATLGAAVLTGGIPIALETGETLGLCFGGTSHWSQRASAQPLLAAERVEVASALKFVEEALGYKIKTQGRLLVQALTHRSFPGDGYCYEREEYLGDAILDYWSTMRLYPLAVSTTPRFLTFRRAMLVSNSTLALIAIRKLRLHKSILHNSPRLDNAIREAAEFADKVEWRDVIEGDLTWVWSPPKVLGDVVEALLAVVFIDSRFDVDTVFAVLDRLYGDITPFLENEKERRDPYSRFLMWKDGHSCDQLKLNIVRSETEDLVASGTALYTSTVTFHSTQIAHQAVNSKTVARQLSAREALLKLEGERGKECQCKERKMKEKKEAFERKKRKGLVESIEAEEDEDEDEAAVYPVESAPQLEEEQEDEAETSEEVSNEEQERMLPQRVREY